MVISYDSFSSSEAPWTSPSGLKPRPVSSPTLSGSAPTTTSSHSSGDPDYPSKSSAMETFSGITSTKQKSYTHVWHFSDTLLRRTGHVTWIPRHIFFIGYVVRAQTYFQSFSNLSLSKSRVILQLFFVKLMFLSQVEDFKILNWRIAQDLKQV